MHDEREIDERERALCSRFSKRLDAALEEQDRLAKNFTKYRKYVYGKQEEDGEAGLVRVNLIHSTIQTILPQIYAKDPELAVTPTEAVSADRYQAIKNFCKTLETVLNRVLIVDGRMKKRAKSAVRSAMTTGLGWVKVSYQREKAQDQQILNRIKDTQDNLDRVRALIKQMEDDAAGCSDHDATAAELEQQLRALQSQVEVVVAEGLVVDRVLTEDIVVLDETIVDLDTYTQSDAIAHRIWMTESQYEDTFGEKPPKTANRYNEQKQRDTSSASSKKPRFVEVFEVWQESSNTVYTLCRGADRYSRPPFQPKRLGEQWYPFFPLAFNPVDGRFMPISDVELLIELQDEYNASRTQYREHREESLPVRVYRKNGGLTDKDLNAIVNRKTNDWVGVEGDPSRPLRDDINILENPPIDPAVYDPSAILRDIEMLSGAQDASKGFINKAKTATEAEIMAMGLQSKTGERQDAIEDWLNDIANYAAEVLLQELNIEQVKRIAGDNAVWPQMPKDEIFSLVSIEIRSGSTGKPNRNKEREQWIQLLPELKQTIQQIAELQASGQTPLAETLIKFVEETLRRFDERIDIEEFLPQMGGEDPRIAQLTQMVQQLQAQLDQATQTRALHEREVAVKEMDASTRAFKAQQGQPPSLIPPGVH